MRKELKIIGSRDRHVFTATFIRFGFRDGYKGPVKTILLQDVLLDGKIVTDHLWFDLTKGFESADLLPSVWHKPSDIAEPGKDCLVEHMDIDGNVCICIDWRSEYEWIKSCHYNKILRWAYIKDLLP